MVVWKREGTLLSASSVKVIRDERISISGTALEFSKVTSKDSGNYTCEINTDTPSYITVTLNVLGKNMLIILFSLLQRQFIRFIVAFRS